MDRVEPTGLIFNNQGWKLWGGEEGREGNGVLKLDLVRLGWLPSVVCGVVLLDYNII